MWFILRKRAVKEETFSVFMLIIIILGIFLIRYIIGTDTYKDIYIRNQDFRLREEIEMW